MKVPEGWVAFPRSDHRRYILHYTGKEPEGGWPKNARTDCSRQYLFTRSERREVPDLHTNNTKICGICRGRHGDPGEPIRTDRATPDVRGIRPGEAAVEEPSTEGPGLLQEARHGE